MQKYQIKFLWGIACTLYPAKIQKRADMSDRTRDSFIFYRSFFESTIPLNKEEKAELFDAICRYALDAEQISLQGFPQAMFSLIKPQLDANRKKWINGCKDKIKSKDQSIDEQEESKSEAKNKQEESKSEGNVNVECKSESKSKGFIKPTLQEIQDYCKERNNGVNPTKFFDYYSASNWKDKDGKQVKNWKQKVITWESRNGNEEKNNQTLCQAINQIIGNDWIIKIEAIEEKAVLSITQANWQKIKGLSDEIKKKIKDKLNQELKTTEIKQKYID